MSEEIRQRMMGLDALGPIEPWSQNGAPPDSAVHDDARPDGARVELIGMHLRVAGALDTGEFSRLSDIVNLRESLVLTDAVLLAGLGQETRIVFPEPRVRLADMWRTWSTGGRTSIPKPPWRPSWMRSISASCP